MSESNSEVKALKLRTITYLDVQDVPQPHRSAIIRGYVAGNGTLHTLERDGWDRDSPEFAAGRAWVFARLPPYMNEVQIRIWW